MIKDKQRVPALRNFKQIYDRDANRSPVKVEFGDLTLKQNIIPEEDF